MNRLKKHLVEQEPALLLITAYCVLILIITFIEFRNIPFEKISLFTSLWTYPLLLIIITVLDSSELEQKLYYAGGIRGYYSGITRDFFPYLIISVIYENLILFREAYADRIPLIDAELMRIDEAIFGIQPAFLMEKWNHPAAVEFFMLAYGLFFVYPYFYLIFLYIRRQYQLFQAVMLAQLIALAISFTSFIVFPAQGPRYYLNPDHSDPGPEVKMFSTPLQGIKINWLQEWSGFESFYALQYDGQNRLERIKTDCMPSMHTCLCLICLFFAVKNRALFKYRRTFVFLWVTGVGALIFSTVYLRYHWVIDVVIGAILAVLIYYLAIYIHKHFRVTYRIFV